jgi:hypothetical protein
MNTERRNVLRFASHRPRYCCLIATDNHWPPTNETHEYHAIYPISVYFICHLHDKNLALSSKMECYISADLKRFCDLRCLKRSIIFVSVESDEPSMSERKWRICDISLCRSIMLLWFQNDRKVEREMIDSLEGEYVGYPTLPCFQCRHQFLYLIHCPPGSDWESSSGISLQMNSDVFDTIQFLQQEIKIYDICERNRRIISSFTNMQWSSKKLLNADVWVSMYGFWISNEMYWGKHGRLDHSMTLSNCQLDYQTVK